MVGASVDGTIEVWTLRFLLRVKEVALFTKGA
jgi:hypothetical protein